MRIVRTATWTAAGALASATVVGVAWSANADSTPAPTSTTAQGGAATAAQHRPGLLRRLEHGSLTVRRGKTDQVLDVQRGTVTAVDTGSISVKSTDGYSATASVDSATKVRKDGKAAGITDVHAGDRVQVVASGGKALRVADRTAASPNG